MIKASYKIYKVQWRMKSQDLSKRQEKALSFLTYSLFLFIDSLMSCFFRQRLSEDSHNPLGLCPVNQNTLPGCQCWPPWRQRATVISWYIKDKWVARSSSMWMAKVEWGIRKSFKPPRHFLLSHGALLTKHKSKDKNIKTLMAEHWTPSLRGYKGSEAYFWRQGFKQQ